MSMSLLPPSSLQTRSIEKTEKPKQTAELKEETPIVRLSCAIARHMRKVMLMLGMVGAGGVGVDEYLKDNRAAVGEHQKQAGYAEANEIWINDMQRLLPEGWVQEYNYTRDATKWIVIIYQPSEDKTQKEDSKQVKNEIKSVLQVLGGSFGIKDVLSQKSARIEGVHLRVPRRGEDEPPDEWEFPRQWWDLLENASENHPAEYSPDRPITCTLLPFEVAGNYNCQRTFSEWNELHKPSPWTTDPTTPALFSTVVIFPPKCEEVGRRQ